MENMLIGWALEALSIKDLVLVRYPDITLDNIK